MRINKEALKAIREKSGHSQLSLAELTKGDVSQGRISELERGYDLRTKQPFNVRPATVKALADALQVPITAITERSDEAA